MQFHALAPPTRAELKKLLRKLIPRPLRKLAVELEHAEPSDWMQLLAQALQTDIGGPLSNDPPRGLCVLMEGFSLHAGVADAQVDRDTLERLARYCARPPFPLQRLSLATDGQVLYLVKHAAPGEPRNLRLSPTQFLRKLAALVPPPRAHLVRFHGYFGPNSKHRARLVPSPRPYLRWCHCTALHRAICPATTRQTRSRRARSPRAAVLVSTGHLCYAASSRSTCCAANTAAGEDSSWLETPKPTLPQKP